MLAIAMMAAAAAGLALGLRFGVVTFALLNTGDCYHLHRRLLGWQ
jgi:hypothetical protein